MSVSLRGTSELHSLALRILCAQDSRAPSNDLSSPGPALSMHDAYEVSWLVHEERLRSGWNVVGRKIGFTNPDMWALFGVTQPVWAFVYDRTYDDVGSHFACALADFVQPKIEPEIVFRMRTAPPPDADDDEVLACIEWIAHGIEMVQCHYPDWKFSATEAVCDSSFHGRLLVGEKRLTRFDDRDVKLLLTNCEVRLFRNDELVEVAHGRNVLGSPLAAVRSLMSAIEREGSIYPIQPGEVITTGTMTKAYSVSPGERWRTAFDDAALGGLTVDFV